VTLAGEYPDGHKVTAHRHGRAQLLHALAGVVTVSTEAGRWMVPPDHAMWIPAGSVHSVEMLGDVSMRSVYVREDAAPICPGLARGGHDGTDAQPADRGRGDGAGRRGRGAGATLLLDLLVEEIAHLPERPLGLPMPADPRLARSAAASWQRTLGARHHRRLGGTVRHEPAHLHPRLRARDRAWDSRHGVSRPACSPRCRA
jgi:hypothetical protein